MIPIRGIYVPDFGIVIARRRSFERVQAFRSGKVLTGHDGDFEVGINARILDAAVLPPGIENRDGRECLLKDTNSSPLRIRIRSLPPLRNTLEPTTTSTSSIAANLFRNAGNWPIIAGPLPMAIREPLNYRIFVRKDKSFLFGSRSPSE
jgi:hypothetical protein